MQLTGIRNNKQPCHNNRADVMENMQKRRLSLLLSQNKENCFDKLEDSETQEEPGANLNFNLFTVIQKLKAFTPKQILKTKSQVLRSGDVKRAGNHLENVVKAKELRQIERLSFLHKFGTSDENVPQVYGEYQQQNNQRYQVEQRVVISHCKKKFQNPVDDTI